MLLSCHVAENVGRIWHMILNAYCDKPYWCTLVLRWSRINYLRSSHSSDSSSSSWISKASIRRRWPWIHCLCLAICLIRFSICQSALLGLVRFHILCLGPVILSIIDFLFHWGCFAPFSSIWTKLRGWLHGPLSCLPSELSLLVSPFLDLNSPDLTRVLNLFSARIMSLSSLVWALYHKHWLSALNTAWTARWLLPCIPWKY